jgi:DNA-binding beta-propeller fold protein YncE
MGQERPTLRQLAMIELPGRPGFDEAVFANGMMLIAHPGASTVDIFDPVKRRLVAQVQKIEDPRGIAVDDPAGRVYIATAGTNSVTVLNSKTWKVEGAIGLKHAPEALVLVPAMKSLMVSNPVNRSVSVISTESFGSTQAELASFDIQGRPQQLAWDPDKKVVYVTVEDLSEIAVIDPAGSGVRQRFKLSASQPTGMVFDPTSRRLFVAVRYAILAIDPDSGAETARVPAANGVDTLWLDSSSHALYAAAADGNVHVLDITGGTLRSTGEFHAAVRGKTLAFDPVNRLVYLTGAREGKSKIVILRPLKAVPPQIETARR